ncbi:RimJ/RimL family protein N-acetyltransferase [Litoreibacter halocynthiae]|uniref:RimJ/RimL family protein N-acetyltransferase n=1 Tax=Litoreibacter halocynthiae TaxID=1242689 RepID=A0A4R7LMJ1_9RHOB|nr:GNAT family N-acetyltransferase [Litoreibacter halocynthiae]TDT75350.1 RimJ/RimL family protein N-acetyltransferase [Litoreibacter halocynthiae]
MNAPTLHTERLTLRAHTRADFPTYRDVFATDHAQYMGGPMSEQQSWAMFCKDVAQWALLGHGAWAVTRTEDGAFVGQVGINAHPYFPETELGWLVMPDAARQGVGFEAARAARDWAFGTLKPASLVSYIDEENVASIALAKRLGAFDDPAAERCPYENHAVYRHPKPEAA